MLYEQVFRIVESYCIDNGIIVGGKIAIEMLLENPQFNINQSPYVYDLYTDEPFIHAKAIADKIFIESSKLHFDVKTVAIESKIKHKYFIVWLNARVIATVAKLDKYRTVKISEAIEPIRVRPIFDNKEVDDAHPRYVLCLNALTLLIQIYQRLYTPYNAKKQYSYTELLTMENSLYNVMSSDKKVIGGSEDRVHYKDLNAITREILKEMQRNRDTNKYVIVGDYAIDALCNNIDTMLNIDTRKHLQVVTATDPQDVLGVVDHIAHRVLAKSKVKYDVSVVKYNITLPGDPFLLRHTYYLDHGDSRHTLLEVFNSTSYELLPIVCKCGLTYGGWFALLRFRLIDVYNTHLLMHLGSYDKFAAVLQKLKQSFDELRTHVYSVLHKNPLDVFSVHASSYAGVSIDANILMKKLASDTKFMYTKYYPYLKFAEVLSDSPED